MSEFAYCPIPKTSASFTSMLTSLYPFQHQTGPNKSKLLEKHITLAEALKTRSYFNLATEDKGNQSMRFQFE